MYIIKMIVISILSIIIAEFLKLDFSVSAGIVAILSLAPNKKDTVKTALQRLYAFVIALLIAFVCFSLFGYGLIAFYIYLSFYIMVCVNLKLNSAIAMNSVLISHFLTTQTMNVYTVSNEVLIFIIGVGLGVLSNLHLTKDHLQIKILKEQTDDKIRDVLLRMSMKIQDQDIQDFDGSCFSTLNEIASNALEVTKLNLKNQFNNKDTLDLDYVLMRQSQITLLQNMFKYIQDIEQYPISGKYIGNCLENIANQFHQENTVVDLIEEVHNLNLKMKELPLPNSRNEFEQRAKLFVLLMELEQFIQLKHDFITKYK